MNHKSNFILRHGIALTCCFCAFLNALIAHAENNEPPNGGAAGFGVNLVRNGSFEQLDGLPAPAPETYYTFPAGDKTIKGWKVVSFYGGGVDLMRRNSFLSVWATDGDFALDLFPSGLGSANRQIDTQSVGGVSQSGIYLRKGFYELWFDLGNSNVTDWVEVSVVGPRGKVLFHQTVVPSLQFVPVYFFTRYGFSFVVKHDTVATLSFIGDARNPGLTATVGPLLDNVELILESNDED
jgi:hypothetical protein